MRNGSAGGDKVTSNDHINRDGKGDSHIFTMCTTQPLIVLYSNHRLLDCRVELVLGCILDRVVSVKHWCCTELTNFSIVEFPFIFLRG